MNKKSQITVFIVIGILIVISVVVLTNIIFNQSSRLQSFSHETERIEEFLDGCAEQAIIKANVKFGIKETSRYVDFAGTEIRECMQDLFAILRTKGFVIKELGKIELRLAINKDNLILSIIYPLEVKLDDSIFSYYSYDKFFLRKQEVLDMVLRSTDRRAIVTLPDNTIVKDINGNVVDLLSIRIEDENFNKLDLHKIYGGVVYQLLPLSNSSNKELVLKIMYSDIELPISKEDLIVVWWDDFSEEWREMPTSVEGDYLKTEITYFTYYGIAGKYPLPEEESESSNIPMPPPKPFCGDGICNENEKCDSCTDCGPCSTIPVCGDNICNGGEDCNKCKDCGVCPPPQPPPFSGSFQEIFNNIKKSMGGTYNLYTDPACTKDIIMWCWVHTACGKFGIWCKENILKSKSEDKLNELFRHEITHNLQHLNGRCGSWAQSEWGADYISGSSYYRFKIATGEVLTMAQIAARMKALGCSDQDLRNAAVCQEGSYTVLEAKGCLIGGGDIRHPP